MRLVTQSEFARLCNVNRSTVNRWLKNNRISADARGMIDPAAADKMRRDTESPMPHHQARKAQIEREKASNLKPAEKTQPATPGDEIGGGSQGAENVGQMLRHETYRLQKAKADAANLDLDKQAGILVERADVDYVLEDFAKTLRAMVEAMPDRLAPSIARHRGDVAAIHAEVESYAADLLQQMSEHMMRNSVEIVSAN